MSSQPQGNPLTQVDVDALPEGTPVIVTWSGGNGPHRYTIGVRHGMRYALLRDAPGIDRHNDPEWRFDCQPEACLRGVGRHPLTQVWLAEEERSSG